MYGLHGFVAAAGFAALAYSPLASGQADLKRFALGLAVVVLLVGQLRGGRGLRREMIGSAPPLFL